jgi:hypothetical protein
VEDVRSGMSCQAEILVDRLNDVLAVPLQAVTRQGSQAVVYVKHGKQVRPQPVELGLDNNSLVHIVSGLEPGDEVVLTPPLAPATKSVEESAAAFAGVPVPATEAAAPPAAGAPGGRRRGEEARLPAEAGAAPAPAPAPAGEAAAERPRTPPTAEQLEEMRRRLESMSPEERERARERWSGRARDGAGGAAAGGGRRREGAEPSAAAGGEAP